nr:hypothetical protein [Tanacetum cinerariifolium]
GEEDDEKVKNETCLVAQASSEACFESSYFSDENSSMDDLALDNKYDKLCKMSLKIITKNKRLKATRNSLEKEISILKKKVSTLEKNKEVDLECVKCYMLKIENKKLKEEALQLTKFEKSTICLNEMLNNQKPSGKKLGLWLNSFEASASETMEIKFLKAQKKVSPDGGPINMEGPLIVQAALKLNMGPPPGATPGSEKSVSFQKSILGLRQKHIIINNKIKESYNVTFDETPLPSKTSPLVDDNLDKGQAIKVAEKKALENNIDDETLKVDEIVNIKESKNHPLENVIRNLNQRTLRSQAQNQRRNNSYWKKKNTHTGSGSVTESDGIMNDDTPLVDASVAKEVISPYVVDKTVAKEKQSSLVDTTGLGSYPPLPTQGTTTAGNTLGKSSYANVIGKPSEMKVNFRTLFTRGRMAYPVVLTMLGTLEFMRNNLLILKKWHSDVNILKEDVGTVPVWVKLHGVPVTTFSEDGLSSIATKLGTPLMLDSYTSDMCMQSWGMSSYARTMIELRADVELKDNIVVAMSKITREGYYTLPVSKKPTANTSRNKKNNVEPTKEVSKSNPFEVLTSIENDVELGNNGGTSNLASQKDKSSGSLFWNVDSNSPKKVVSSYDYDSEDEVTLVDNEMDSFLAKNDGYGTQSLLEQWKESYENDDYEYNPYDDDLYEGQKIPNKLQAICDNLDITVRGRRKKQFSCIIVSFIGQCSFSDKWSLDDLKFSVPTSGPYQTNPPSPDDIKLYVQEERVTQRKTQKDYGTRRGRSSTSSLSAFGQPSSSHPNDDDDDDDDGNDEETSRVNAPPRPSNLISLQSHPSLDITVSLSPITTIDHLFESPSPPSPPPPPQQPIMSHPIYFNILDYHEENCLCCFYNRNLILFLRDEMHFMFFHLEYLLTSAIASPSPPYP